MNRFISNTYWIAVAHLPKWTIERTNRLIIKVIHEKNMSWEDFFALSKKEWAELFTLTEKELSDLEFVKSDLPRHAFIAEQLQNEGVQIIPINSPDYPSTLKENLKIKSSPPVLYIKGKKTLLQNESVAIVGSRKSSAKALAFTDMVAKKNVKENKLIVSGFAKGVDKQALDSALEAKGKSIIIIPQGILTFQSGFKKYYEPIVNGDALVLSTFYPKAGWNVGLAMARNTYIYGLAHEIYVAESDFKGGTWEGVMDGLKRGRKIYVRYPDLEEKNANGKLIELGALPVNMNGEIIEAKAKTTGELLETPEISKINVANEPIPVYEKNNRNIEKEILALLSKGSYTSKEILLALKLDWDSRKLTAFLKKNPNIKTIPGRPAKYMRNDITALSLFE